MISHGPEGRVDATDARTHLLLDAASAAQLVGFSRSHFYELVSREVAPGPVRPGGGRPRWIRAELEAWCLHGCPPQREWKGIWREARGG